jgi:type II secretory pathway component PulM
MKAWFANLEPRERLIFMIGSIAALLIIAWAFVLKPLRAGTAELREAVATKQELLVGLGRVEGLQGQGVESAPADQAELSLVVLVDRTAQERGLTLPRKRQEGQDALNVTIQNTSADALFGWLISLEATHSVSVESGSISGARELGLVNGQLTLRRR